MCPFTAQHQIYMAILSNSFELWNYKIHPSVTVFAPAQWTELHVLD